MAVIAGIRVFDFLMKLYFHDAHDICGGGFSFFQISRENTGGDDTKIIFLDVAFVLQFFYGFLKYDVCRFVAGRQKRADSPEEHHLADRDFIGRQSKNIYIGAVL